MNLRKLKDQEILSSIKMLVQREREVLTDILHHLKEVEFRKLFSDLGYQSLFEYAVRELKYSEGQTSRRIQAMRLLKEIPELEEKIQSGSLSLSNISQAQSYFRQAQVQASPVHKIEVLEKLENKSAREGERFLLSLDPSLATTKEKQRQISETQTQVSFIMTDELKESLEKVKALLGPKALSMSFADLVLEMSQLSLHALHAKNFGKKRSRQLNAQVESLKSETLTPTSAKPRVKNRTTVRAHGGSQKLPKALRFQVWTRDHGQCTKCASRINLNIDHIRPKALGGDNDLDNLRLLCFHCNQRHAMKSFGVEQIRSFVTRRLDSNPNLEIKNPL